MSSLGVDEDFLIEAIFENLLPDIAGERGALERLNGHYGVNACYVPSGQGANSPDDLPCEVLTSHRQPALRQDG